MRGFILVLALGMPLANFAGAQTPTTSYRSQEWNGHALPPVSSAQVSFDPMTAGPVWEEPLVTTDQVFASQSPLRLDFSETFPLLNFQNRQSDKQLDILDANLDDAGNPSLTLGAQFRLSGMVARTNRENKFSYLGRFPPDFTGSSATDLRIVQANQAAVARITPWATGYVETLFSDVFTFPAFNQGSFQVRQAYVVFGDLDVSPIYGFIGKKNVSFGDFGTLSPFTQAVPWHYFAPLAEGGGIGMAFGGFNATISLLNGGRGIRVADSSDIGSLNNIAVNTHYTYYFDDVSHFRVGAGWLQGTIYDGTAAEHINPMLFGSMNPAWDVNGQAQFGPVVFSAEYVQTVNDWPVVAHPVHAWKAETAYDATTLGQPWVLSASWSSGVQGAKSDEWEFNNQLVIGLRYDAAPNVQLSFEYIRSLGFAPLINITTVSDKDVRQNTYLFGMTLAI